MLSYAKVNFKFSQHYYNLVSVSYTHLDVYKRQDEVCSLKILVVIIDAKQYIR